MYFFVWHLLFWVAEWMSPSLWLRLTAVPRSCHVCVCVSTRCTWIKNKKKTKNTRICVILDNVTLDLCPQNRNFFFFYPFFILFLPFCCVSYVVSVIVFVFILLWRYCICASINITCNSALDVICIRASLQCVQFRTKIVIQKRTLSCALHIACACVLVDFFFLMIVQFVAWLLQLLLEHYVVIEIDFQLSRDGKC